MARQYTVEIDGQRYQGATASAKNQFEALHIAGRTGLVALLKPDAADMSLVTLLLQIPFADVQRLIELLVKGQVVREADNVPVAENLFGDAIHNYYLLLAHALRENLAGFWQLRRPTTEGAAERSQ